MNYQKKFLNEINLKKNFDIKNQNIISINNEIIKIYYLSSLIDESLYVEIFVNNLDKLIQNPSLYLFNIPKIKKVNDYSSLINNFYFGEIIIFFENKLLSLDIKKIPGRSISEPDSEKSLRGAKDGFVENIMVNISLIRTRIKSSSLKCEMFSLSRYSKLSICLIYLDSRVNKRNVKILKNKIKNLKIDSLIMSDRSLEEKLFAQKFNLFPLVRYTQRGDVSAIQILNGKIVIMVDTSSSVLITPSLFLDHLKHVEEYRQVPLIGSLTRLIRFLSMILSLFLSPYILASYLDHDYSFYFSLQSVYTNGELIFQMFASSIIIEIFRLAIIHTPSILITALSLISALILSQISIELNIFSGEILLIVSLSTICGFALPSFEFSLSLRVCSFLLLILVSFFKMEGLTFGIIILFIYLVNIKIFDIPYLYPLCPLNIKKLKEYIFRVNNKDKKTL